MSNQTLYPGMKSVMFKFDLSEFLLIPESEKATYWIESGLPHPGCPVSFKVMIDFIYASHRLPKDLVYIRTQAIKNLIGNIKVSQEGVYLSCKDKWLPIGIDTDSDSWGDNQLLALILEGMI